MRINRFSRCLVSMIAACLLLLAINSQLLAHGANGKLQFSQTEVGPYFVSIWSEPAIMRTGDIRFEAFVVDSTLTPDFDCAVEIKLTSLDSDRAPIYLQTQAPEDGVVNLTHEINYSLMDAGRYSVDVTVVDAAGAVGVKQFEIEVTSVPVWLKIGMNGFLLLILVIVLSMLMKGLSLFGLWQEVKPGVKPTGRRPI